MWGGQAATLLASYSRHVVQEGERSSCGLHSKVRQRVALGLQPAASAACCAACIGVAVYRTDTASASHLDQIFKSGAKWTLCFALGELGLLGTAGSAACEVLLQCVQLDVCSSSIDRPA